MGTLYQRGKKGIWWIKFYRDGKPYFESSRSTRKKDARARLALREGKVADGSFTGLRADKVRYEDMAADFVNDYKINEKKTLKRAEQKKEVLAGFFAGRRAVDITTADVRAYVAKRQEEGAAPASINRELAALKRMFNLAVQAEKIHHKPYILRLREDNVRTGFFGEVEFLALHEALPAHLQPVAAFAYTTGWRRGEVLGLTWERVDLGKGVVRLDPGTTKNGQGRTVVLTDDLRATLVALWERTRALVAKRKPDPTPREVAQAVPWVFWHRNGRPIRDFRKAWDTAWEAAKIPPAPCRACKGTGVRAEVECRACKGKGKVPGRLFHDLRRTAVRNMVRKGIPDAVAMKISGHLTRSVFDRYNIVSEGDLHEAARRMAGHLPAPELVTVNVTVPGQNGRMTAHDSVDGEARRKA